MKRLDRYFFNKLTLLGFRIIFFITFAVSNIRSLDGFGVGDKTYKRRWFNVLSAACETSQISMYPHGKAIVNVP